MKSYKEYNEEMINDIIKDFKEGKFECYKEKDNEVYSMIKNRLQEFENCVYIDEGGSEVTTLDINEETTLLDFVDEENNKGNITTETYAKLLKLNNFMIDASLSVLFDNDGVLYAITYGYTNFNFDNRDDDINIEIYVYGFMYQKTYNSEPILFLIEPEGK